MNSTKQILMILACLSLYAPVIAQERQPAAPSRDSREVTIIIQQQQLRFIAPASAQELKLEVFNQAGETIYDSGLVSGPELSWALRNASGEGVPSGLYAYTLSVKEANSETPTLRRGHLILESGRDRLWVTSQDAIGAEASMSGGELTASSGPEMNVVGARIGRSVASKGSPINLSGFGTAGQIAKFGGGDFLVNSVIAEDSSGRIGIGTTTPTSALTVAGQIEMSSGGIKFPNGSVQTTAGLSQVVHNATLTGNGNTDSPLGIADNGVTAPKIAAGQVVKSLNGLRDNVTLAGTGGISITPSGNTLTIASSGLGSVAHDATLIGNGTSGSPLHVALPVLGALFVAENGDILTCYNGITGEFAANGTSGCGFFVDAVNPPIGFGPFYEVSFPSGIQAAFWSVTTLKDSTNSNVSATTDITGGGLTVDLFYGNERKNRTFAPFMLILY